MNGKQRQSLADRLSPLLAGRDTTSLRYARELLHDLEPSMAAEIDGMEASHILKRAGFTKDYSRVAGPSIYRRKAA